MSIFKWNQNNYKVEFTGEAEVYWPTAHSNWVIPKFEYGASVITITNTWQTAVTIAPWYRGTVPDSWISGEIAVAFAGIPLDPADDDGNYGGRVIFDTASNGLSIDIIRAVVHGWGDWQLSFSVL